jgi:hypothetical protein
VYQTGNSACWQCTHSFCEYIIQILFMVTMLPIATMTLHKPTLLPSLIIVTYHSWHCQQGIFVGSEAWRSCQQ